MKMFKDAADLEDVHYSIGTAWEEAGKTKDAIEAYMSFSEAWRRKDPVRALNAQYKAYRLMEKTKARPKDLDAAYLELEKQARSYQRSGSAKPKTPSTRPTPKSSSSSHRSGPWRRCFASAKRAPTSSRSSRMCQLLAVCQKTRASSSKTNSKR